MSLNDDSLNDNSLLNGTNNEALLKNCFRLVILGAPKTGKTCIIDWFLGKQFKDSYLPTIEDFHRKIYKIKGEIYRLDILDTSGNDPFPAMKKLNIMTGDIFVLVFNIDDVDSYVQIKQLLELIKELKKSKQDGSKSSHTQNVPILILGNKLDYLIDGRVPQRCFQPAELQQITSSNKSCVFYEVSCKRLIGLDLAFETFFQHANMPVEMIPSKHRRVSLNLDLTKPQFSTHKQHHNSDSSSPPSSASYLSKTPGNNALGGGGPATSNAQTSGNSLTVDGRSGSIKKKSFRKMTFRKQLSEACGAVWLNARRPSIRAELKLLQLKNTSNFNYPNGLMGLNMLNGHGQNNNNGRDSKNMSRNSGGSNGSGGGLVNAFRKLFMSCAASNKNRSGAPSRNVDKKLIK